MDGEEPSATLKNRHKKPNGRSNGVKGPDAGDGDARKLPDKPAFMKWKAGDVANVAAHHPVPAIFAVAMLFFVGVEYTLPMVPAASPPFDLGFVATQPLHRLLVSNPGLNTLLAGLNTVFVGMQTAYIVWAWVVEGRPRAAISAVFMFTCRGVLGYSTQLPLPQGFLGSGADFPVGNVSFFLFYSGHVAAAVIAAADMRRVNRRRQALIFDALNVMQGVRLLSTRGHYTIDLAVGVGAGILFDSLAGKYEETKKGTGAATVAKAGEALEGPTWSALDAPLNEKSEVAK